MPSLNLNLRLNEDTLRSVLDSLADGGDERLRSAKVVVGAPYASSMEFGTMPAKNAGPKQARTFRKKDGSTFTKVVSDSFWNIYLWATRHAEKLDPYDFAVLVYEKIMSEGLAPHPYVRPALYEFEDRFNDIFKQQGSLLGAAEVLAEMIKDNLNGGVAGAPINDTGVLRDSIEASYAEEGDDKEDYPDRAIWDIPDGDIYGNTGGGSA